MGFIITVLFVIFGGVYYIIKCISYSAKDTSIDRKRKDDKDRRQSFMDSVCDESLEIKIRTAINDRDLDGEDPYKKACEIFGNPEWGNVLEHDYGFVRRVLLANEGKLSKLDASGGIGLGEIHVKKTAKTAEKILARNNFVVWITDKLKEHGVYITPVVINVHNLEYRKLTHNNVNHIEEDEYYWEEPVSSCYKKVS